MEFIINYWAVLAGAVANMALGAYWYSPIGFGKPWMRLMGWDPEDKEKMAEVQKGANKAYAGSFIGALLMAYILAHFVVLADAVTFADGAMLAFWVWLGFVATTHFNNVLFENKPCGLWAIGMGYYLVSLVILATILTLWK